MNGYQPQASMPSPIQNPSKRAVGQAPDGDKV